ncbi:uncharacterized protein E0L32_010529 [Thyridium curvatum]|uniref:Uncharacterized protein n=1 Tax=Thyridium curvatum TaxID=1093900 RepID=A0A507AL05_9PEZI|nr:uncharacterized protein E0L32_010529 [Thyridium curvatum]TPX07737.1 hypothetical protein E0L32_010529 [Thyridium curvatum]
MRMAGAARVPDLASLPADRLAWRPARQSPRYLAARQAEDFAAWQGWQESVARKARVLAGQQAVSQDAARKRRAARNAAAARLQIRLPDGEGKTIPGSGGEVQIVGSREWEALQGRRVAVM